MKAKRFILLAAALVLAGVLLGVKWISDGRAVNEDLDGRNESRERSETAEVYALFAEDPARAEARLSKMPLEMRAEILRQADAFHKMREGEEIAYAEIVRRQLDEKGRVAAIAERARKTLGSGGDFAAVDEYLNSVYAAPDERERAAEEVAWQHTQNLVLKNELNVAKIEHLREWVVRDAPESVDRLTGNLLGMAANMNSKMDFDQLSALALRYHEAAGNDEVLHAFLTELSDKANKAEARQLAEKISNSEKRKCLVKKFQ